MGAGRFAVMLLCAGSFADAELHIEVVRGEGNNNLFGRPGPPIILRVSDDAGKPVADAAVIFSSPDTGPSVDFAGGGRAAQAQTDERGGATAPSLRPSDGNGPVEISVFAEKDGDAANAVVHLMNLGFMADAAAPDLDVRKVEAPVAKGRSKRVLRVGVIDGAGHPVAGAKVSLWVPGRRSGHADMPAVESGADGTAEFELDGRIVRGSPEVLVRAVAQGLAATRFISLD